MVYIRKGKKTKMKEVGDVLRRHHDKTLPKSYYTKKGNLFPSVFLHGERKSVAEKRNEEKNKTAEARGADKIKEKAKRGIKKDLTKLSSKDLNSSKEKPKIITK